LRSLAADAGVSTMAFPLALRNSPEIAPKTRERLKRLARLRSYRPDPILQLLKIANEHERQRSATSCSKRATEKPSGLPTTCIPLKSKSR
jgi:DNA-binding LacI/PurR family transcriptional regulator